MLFRSPRSFESCLTFTAKGPIQCLTLSETFSEPIIRTSILSGLSCRKLSDIHSLMAVKHSCNVESLLRSLGLNDRYNCVSSA